MAAKKVEKHRIRCDNFVEDVAFTGKQIACSSSWKHYGDAQNRYTQYTLYETETGKYVLLDEYITHWQGEDSSTEIVIFDDLEDLRSYILYPGSEAETGHLPRWKKEFMDECGLELVKEI